MEHTKKINNEQNDVNLDNIRVPVFKKKNIAAITVKTAKPAVKKLLTAPTNIVLKRERKDKQDMSIKKI